MSRLGGGHDKAGTSRLLRRATATFLVVTLAGMFVSATGAQEKTAAIDLETIEYATSPLFPGVEIAIVFGGRTTPGLYATHARVAAGAMIPPHTHPNPLTTWVTSGTAYVGTGLTLDEGALQAYPTGTFFVTPAGSPHFIVAKDGPFSILDHGDGPSGIEIIANQP